MERPSMPAVVTLNCETVAKLEFCLAIGGHTGLGLRNMAESGFSGQQTPASGEPGRVAFH